MWTDPALNIHRKPGGVYNELIGVAFTIANNSGQQIIIGWKNSVLHLTDNTGREYPQYGVARAFQQWKQFTLSPGKTTTIDSMCDTCETSYGSFEAVLGPDVQYLVFRIDEIAGLTNMNWRYTVR